MVQRARARGFWLPAPWLEDLERLEREHGVEHGHISRLREDLLRSDTLRAHVEAPEPGPRRAWLCFLALVDIYVDPFGWGLPLPSIHPPRLPVSAGWVFDDHFWEPGKRGFVRDGTPPGIAQAGVVERLALQAVRLRQEAEMLRGAIERDGQSLDARCWEGSPAARWRDDAPIAFSAYRQQRYALHLRMAEVRALTEAADALERARSRGPRVYRPPSGDVREGPPALMALLDFTLGTDPALTKPAREALIADVVTDFFPRAVQRRQEPKEYVRTTLKDMRRRALRAQEKADLSGNEPQGAIATFAAAKLHQAGVVGRWTEREVAAAPNGKGVRFVLEVATRG